MASTAMENHKKMIHTAGCIIIGDEVLGGKVSGVISLLKSEPIESGKRKTY